MSPHSRPSRTIEIDIDALTPMFRRYSTWTGDTLRSAAWLMSSGFPLRGLTAGSTGLGR